MITRALLLTCGVVLALPAGAQSLAKARSQAREGNIDVAISEAKAVTSASPSNAEAHSLLCALYGSVDDLDSAVNECETARDQQPNNDKYVLNLAIAYGARAEHAGPFTGMRMVGKVRSNFERAAELNPQNVEALSDLGEFYVEAPGMVGGGVDKARKLLPKLQELSPARAHRLAGMIAAHESDWKTADAEYGQELAAAHSPEAYVDLANYYRKRKMWDQSSQNAVLAIRKDEKHGPDTVDAAKLLIEEKRNVSVAIQGLHQYLATPQESVVAPAPRAHTLLGQALAMQGDSHGSQQEYAAALALAHRYEPARKAAGQ